MYSTAVYFKRGLVTQAKKVRAVVSEQQLQQQVIFNTLCKERKLHQI